MTSVKEKNSVVSPPKKRSQSLQKMFLEYEAGKYRKRKKKKGIKKRLI